MKNNNEISRENVHETFDDINHAPLKAYNRVVLMTNLKQSVSDDEARRYAGLFSTADRKKMMLIMQFIKKFGVDKTRSIVTRDLKIVTD